MEIQYWGTAAAEGIPAVFCDCAVCAESRRLGGRNIRTRSQAIIDGTLLIDFPADTYTHALAYDTSLVKIHSCLITHNHFDHLYAPELENRKDGFCHTTEGALTFYGTDPACRDIERVICAMNMQAQDRVRIQEIEAFVPFTVQGYTVTPLEADHDPRTQPVIYLIERNGTCLLYANDTGYFPESTWNYLQKTRPQFSLISLDCTEAMTGLRHGHMSLEAVREVRQRLMEQGFASEETLFILTHFSHNGKATYDELVPLADAGGFLVAYDGMTVQVDGKKEQAFCQTQSTSM